MCWEKIIGVKLNLESDWKAGYMPAAVFIAERVSSINTDQLAVCTAVSSEARGIREPVPQTSPGSPFFVAASSVVLMTKEARDGLPPRGAEPQASALPFQ